MANINAALEEIAPIGGSNGKGMKLGYLNGATKAAQNDTVTITNAKMVEFANISLDATGTAQTNTIATNVITVTAATAGTVSGFVYYLAK